MLTRVLAQMGAVASRVLAAKPNAAAMPMAGRMAQFHVSYPTGHLAKSLENLLYPRLNTVQAERLSYMLWLSPQVGQEAPPEHYSQGEIAQAISIGLVSDVAKRSKLTNDILNYQHHSTIDHFALRTFENRREDIESILKHMGYVPQEMTIFPEHCLEGRGWEHAKYPRDVPKYFVSEWCHQYGNFSTSLLDDATRLSKEVQDAAVDVRMRLGKELEQTGKLDFSKARLFTLAALSRFAVNHKPITAESYQRMIDEGAQTLAWLATNGQQINHLARLVPNIEREKDLLETRYGQKELCYVANPQKTIEQITTKAQLELVPFAYGSQLVPGAFYEAVTRREGYNGFNGLQANQIFHFSTTVKPVEPALEKH